jgi:hypothetical protein
VATCSAADAAGAAGLGSCARALDSIRLEGPHAVALASVERIRRDLGSASLALGREVIQGRKELATAPIARDQAEAATTLRRSYSWAAQVIAGIPTPRGTTDLSPVVEALEGTAAAYDALAAAIPSGDPRAFDEARGEILRQEDLLEARIRAAAIP